MQESLARERRKKIS
jgi:hypothetical protein